MRCPAGCDATLVMAERQGIEIDYCPSCRGVWLDRGELDKIIERSHAAGAPAPPSAGAPLPPPPPAQGWREPYVATRPYGAPGSPPPGYGRRKRRGFLDELFDF
ncbi:TFIIB-type zinc ribbon-containing protein [Rhabdothermincola sp.]|uniref:TFIIB-type zinc ribbon-containing protein n=1 Tax=Rhabdothermincola sp. TaxID=2820405 RepID=UPI002FE0492A